MGFGIRQRPTTPLLSARQLEDLGVKAVSYPRLLSAAAIQGMKNAMEVLNESITEGVVIDRPDLLVSFGELNDLMGYRRIKELEQTFLAGAIPAGTEIA
jgi:2-methylisocitrate lyase-like PEP mutase family enzyme